MSRQRIKNKTKNTIRLQKEQAQEKVEDQEQKQLY
jgi:hypothetical protein